jgi:hypothetical protein
MILAIKEMILVLVISLGVFKLAKPVAQKYCPAQDFAARCKVWLLLTVGVFLAPGFWIFIFVATPVLIRLRKKDSNPAAAFLFLHTAVPPCVVRIPMIFDLSFHLFLIFCLLAPTARQQLNDKLYSRAPSLKVLDILLLAYCVLSAWFFLRPEIAPGVLMQPTFTDCVRKTLVISCELYIPYFVISRTSQNRAAIQDMMASFTINCMLLAAVATFESARHWLLYGEFLSRWGFGSPGYLGRAGALRAMASSGHPLTLGYLLAVAFGFWLYLQKNIESKATRWALTCLFLSGLLAAYSRGPWVGAILIYFAYAALGPRAFQTTFKAVAGGLFLALVVAVSPLGAKIASVVPYFGGTVDMSNVIYRERLLDVSWRIIMDHPLLGDPDALLKMAEMRQGEGIIDLMNGFVAVLLNNGFVGLSLFGFFVIIASIKTLRLSAATAKSDPDLSKLGASLVACLLGCMIMMWAGGLLDEMTGVLVGFMAAYVDLGRRNSRDRESRKVTTHQLGLAAN